MGSGGIGIDIKGREGYGSGEKDGVVHRGESFGGGTRIFERGLSAGVRCRGPTAGR